MPWKSEITDHHLIRAEQIAREVHQDMKYDNRPYFEAHVQQVCNALSTRTEKVVALLHDTIEDSKGQVTPYSLSTEFPDFVAEAVVSVTRKAEDTYLCHILRAMNNPVGIMVKAADLNVNIEHSGKGSRKDKYILAEHLIDAEMDRIIALADTLSDLTEPFIGLADINELDRDKMMTIVDVSALDERVVCCLKSVCESSKMPTVGMHVFMDQVFLYGV